MSILVLPGARLYYETHGRGPLLLMVPGASGTADIFKGVAAQLAAHYTVVTYDRRGFSRSYLEGPQDYEHRLETDVEDVRRLIEHVSDAPATLFGSSSGGVVVLAVLTSHPSVVRTLVPYEAAAVRLLPEGQQWVDFLLEIYALYRHAGLEPALQKFRAQSFAEVDRQAMARATDLTNGEIRANATYWFERELRQYPAVDLDLEALKTYATRIVPTAGRASRGYPTYAVNAELAKKLGRELVELPGGHAGYAAHPAEFARELVQALGRTGV
jgi:pimeloyl-ACP methyl ester carboxylesterase